MAILKLQKDLIELISDSGSKITDLKSIVKELVENAIDAGASKIEIYLLDGGGQEIKVIDNGSGMNAIESKVALESYTSSKVNELADFERPHTLGMYGKALFELATLSSLKISTAKDSRKGIMFTARGGKIISEALITRDKGTEIIVRQIFKNDEKRLERISDKPHEIAKIISYLVKISLCYPRISFFVSNNGRQLLKTSGNGDVLDVISLSYGNQIGINMMRIFAENSTFRLSGFIAPASETRETKDNIHLFINQRIIETSSLVAAVREGYRPLLSEGKYPIVVINIETSVANLKFPKTASDQLTIENETEILSLIIETIKKTLARMSAEPKKPQAKKTDDYTFISDMFMEDTKGVGEEELFDQLPELVYKGEIFDKYLVTEGGDNLYLVDKDKAFQILFFYKLLNNLTKEEIVSFPLVKPISLPLTSDEKLIFLTNTENDYLYGMDFEPSEDGITVKTIPSFIKANEAEEFAKVLVKERIVNKTLFKQEFLIALAEHLAERLSMFYPRIENIKEINFLLEDIVKVRNPYSTPSGDLAIVKVDSKELKSWFQKRH